MDRSWKENCRDEPKGLCKPNMRSYDYSFQNETKDQRDIRLKLTQLVKKNDVILHVGIGNSRVALDLFDKVKRIEGITVANSEFEFAENLSINNYKVSVIDKYSLRFKSLTNKYNIIMDNNISGFACCRKHYLDLLYVYFSILYTGGSLYTHIKGLEWSVPGSPTEDINSFKTTCRKIGFFVDIDTFGVIKLTIRD